MADLAGFNAETVEPAEGFEPIPAGDYVAVITDSEMKPTAAGTGKYLNIEFELLGPTHVNRKLWSRLNLENPSEKAVQIARGELSAICRAVGVMKPKDSSELHHIPLKVRVVIEKRKDNGEDTNRIKKYMAKDAPESAVIKGKAGLADEETPPWKR